MLAVGVSVSVINFFDTGKFVQCSSNLDDTKRRLSPSSVYECNGNLYCFDAVTGFLETCLHGKRT